MAEYVIIIEKAGNNYAAMVPDLPGCIGAADTVEELEELMREAMSFISRECAFTVKRFHHPTRASQRSGSLHRSVRSHFDYRTIDKCLSVFVRNPQR